jgi:hypothetical protein
MPHITIHEPMPLSAVAFYRSIGVFSYLSKLDPTITISVPESISWAALSGTDIFYMQRPQSPRDLLTLNMARNFNIPVWVDYDDLLHEIPRYNPGWDYFRKPPAEPLNRIIEAITAADIVTVSTPAIRDYYLKYNKNIHVIENAHNDYRYPLKIVNDTYENVNWRGSNTHRQDILSVATYIFDLAQQYSNWKFSFIGNDLWYITERIPNCIHLKECDIIDYFYFIREWKSAIQINPLLDNAFNIAKSNIAFIEGTYAGSATIAPDLPEFSKCQGAILYTPDDGKIFAYQLEKCMKSKSYRQEKYRESFEYVRDNLLLSQVNRKRIEIIGELICR